MKLLGLTTASTIMANPLRGLMVLTGLATDATTPIQAFAASKPTAELFYTDTGKGKNMMLLHGWSCFDLPPEKYAIEKLVFLT